MTKTQINKNADGVSRQVERIVSKHKIFVPFDVIKIKCMHCGIEFAIIAIIDNDYMLQGNNTSSLYCPYCGKTAY